MNKPSERKSKFLNPATIIAVVGAFVIWGAWAYWINRASAPESAIRAGLTQGIYSGAMTFYMSFAVYFFWQRTRHLRLWWLWPTVATVGHTGLLLVAAHWLNHTPNLAKTVSAPLLVAVIYCLALTRNFRKAAESERQA